MTSEHINTCKRCHITIQASAELCIACFRHLHHACPKCMVPTATGTWRVRRNKNDRIEVDCIMCLNQRWLLYDYQPLPLPPPD